MTYESDNPQFDHLINNLDSDEVPRKRVWRVVFPDGHEFDCPDREDAERNARIYRGDGAVVMPPGGAS